MDLDWRTLVLQTVNVLILIWLLKKFFWQPVAAMIEQRRVTAKNLLDAAQAKQDAAAAALAEITATRAGFAQERAAILAAAQAEAEQAREASLKETTQAADALEAAAQARIAAARKSAEAAWRERASQLAVEIAGRLAARLEGAAVLEAFLGWLLKEIAALPPALRQAETLELVSATPLPPDAQADCQRRIAQAFGGAALLTFKTDPALIAGLELRGPNLLVRNSWRADLDRIRAELAHD